MSRIGDFEKLSPAKQKLLLARLRKREEAEQRTERIPRSPLRDTGEPFPLSFAQQRLWFIDRLAPGTAVYNVADSLLLEGRLDVPALERTLGAIVRRHEALRTVFDAVDGRPVQRVVPAGDERFPIPVVDLSGLDPQRADAEARRLAAAEAVLPFDVPRGPHLRARLVFLGGGDTDEHGPTRTDTDPVLVRARPCSSVSVRAFSPERWLALLTMHHIVSDGWSMGVLVRELGAFYSSFAAGGQAVLSPLPIQYPDFAGWQRATLQGELLDEHIRWWRERLAGAPPSLDLPADHPRPPVQRHRGAALRDLLPADLAAAAGSLARERGATPFMVLLAAFSLHLARHAGQDDVVVGSPVANRNRIETEGLIGFFVNTLVLRVDAGERPGRTFLDLLDEVRQITLGAYAHQDLPFERLVEELKPERDLSRPPLFQISIALQNTPLGDLDLPGLTLAPFPVLPTAAVVDLSLDAMETPAGIHVEWRYDIDLFAAPTVERMAERFGVLLRAAVAEPARALDNLPLLPESERDQLLTEWSFGAPPVEAPLFHEQFAAWAERAPQAPALFFGDEVWTYAELAERAGELARRLLELADREAEARVGLCLERSPGLIASMLAALAAGLPFVPLDPAYPADRLAYMAADAGIAVLVTTRALAGRVALPPGARTLFVDEDADLPLGRPAAPLDPDRLAYVLYTSGSTGRPKGVMVAHRGLANLATVQSLLLGVRPESRVLQFASPSFDASVWEVTMALGAGAALRLAPREALLPGPDLARNMAGWEVTHAHLSPSSLAVTPSDGLPDLACALSGGEPCPPPLAARWSAGRLFVNAYGPTEGTVCATVALFAEGNALEAPRLSIGRPIPGIETYVVDRLLRLAPLGVPGELWIGGLGLTRGYHGRPELTAERFVPHPFAAAPGARLYRTGDLVRWRPDGQLDFLGRIDRQVKVRGVRIEPGEIEGILIEHPDVEDAAVAVRPHAGGPRLVAWVVLHPKSSIENPKSGLRAWAADHLPEALVPSVFVVVPEMPLTPAGKVDRDALPDPGRSIAALPAGPRAGLESTIAEIWCEVLGVERVGRDESFFDLGGHSLLLVQVQSRLRAKLDREIPILDLFRFPDVASLARHLTGEAEEAQELVPVRQSPAAKETRDVAVIGLACRFPGAPDSEAFWENLRAGIESIRFFSEEELLEAGVGPAVLADPSYVRACGVLDGADLFDAPFFDIGPREAQLLDPQHRVLLECAAEALERAGRGAGSPALRGQRVGVFAGTGMSVYGIGVAAVPGVDGLEVTIANDKDFVATRIAYELDLRGPAVAVQTACSTSLVAVHMACKALLDGECDLALAGGVTIQFPQVIGYLWREGGISSPDGHNRAFDAEARGTVGGNGAGIVVLKPLAAALADGDPIHAVIKATALNNDGSEKIGFTAPSERGEAEVIAQAQALAGVPAETIGYVEAHGSATPLGDPIEVAALMRAFRARAAGEAWPSAVFLGSVKTNIGHTGSAAGVAGLIKTVLALEHREIPPSLWFEEPNPRIDFAAGPFQVATGLTPWEPPSGVPRRAGVSSFGLGGTNAHAILEEGPEPNPGGSGRSHALIALSARTPTALEAATDRLAGHLRELSEETALGDVAFTLLTGRKAHEHRRIVVATDAADAAAALASRDPRRVLSAATDGAPRAVAFVLAGLGEQYPGLARGLYEAEPVFREELDRAAELLAPRLGVDLRTALFTAAEERGSGELDLRRMLGRGGASDAGPLDRTEVLQPALFAVEHALARLWMAWGIAPAALLGYSLGEYVAACLAGVFSLEDALRLVAERARWIAEVPAGAMLAVPLPEEDLRPWMEGSELDLAATNGPRTSVVSGPPAAVADLEPRLAEAGLPARRLRTTHAFHSRAMWPVAGRLIELVREIGPRPPRIPLLSNVTGTWMTEEQATDPGAWAEHLLRPVRFAEGIAELWREPGRVLLEIGPGQSLSSLALQHPAAAAAADPVALPSLPSAWESRHDLETLQTTLGKLWLAGVAADWPAVWAREERRRIELPTYPFERQRYWLQGEPRMALPGDHLDQLAGQAEALLATVRTADLTAIEEQAAKLASLLRQLQEGRGRETTRELEPRAAIALHPRPGLRTAYAEPATELERMVAGLWQRLLGIDRIGRHDSFFDLGGDSLLATQALTRVRDAFGVEIPLPALFEDPTPAGAAALIERLRGEMGETASREVIPRQPRDGRAFPTSFAQERLWVIDQIEPESIAYNLPAALRLSGRLRIDLLARAFTEIVRRHETLRTTFAAGSGGPVQIIHPPGPPSSQPVPLADLTALPAADRETEVRRLAIEEGSTPFDLARGPVLRIRLLRLAEEEHALLLTLHHIASDGWSSGVLVGEIAALYDAFSHGRPSPLPELPVQYADYAVWQRQAFQGEDIAASLDWWSRRLAGAPVLELPTDRPRPAVQGTGGGFVHLDIPGALGEELEALARREGATLFMVVTAAFQALLSRLSGQDDLTVGTPVANRHHREVEGLIGFFVNTLVLRTDLSGDPAFRDLLARVRRVSLEALEHGQVPFSQVVEAIRPERSLSHTPLFQVMVQLANAPRGTLEIPGLRFTALEAPIDSAMFDLNLSVAEVPGGLHTALEYRTDLFDRTTAQRLLERYAGLLAAVVAASEMRLSEVPLLTVGERQALVEWDLTPWPPLPSHTLPPGEGETALVHNGQTWTFREIHDRVARLTAHLRRLGVGPGSRVGVQIERSREMVEAVLATLLAGAAYVPFDPAYPAERLAFMLEDAGVAVLLTQEKLRELLAKDDKDLKDPKDPKDTSQMPSSLSFESFRSFGSLDLSASPDDLAYVIYTSGSTGRPKGVAMTRGALANLLAWQETVLPGPARTLQFASLSFDVSFQEIVSTWITGGTLVLVDEETRRDPFALLALLDRERVERLFLPFVALRQLAEAAGSADSGLALRDVVTAGEQLQVTRAVRDWLGRMPGVRLHNQYGPTESHVVTALTLTGDPGTWPPLPAIGRPLPNVPVRILDAWLEALPIGARGELCIGGVALARGYLDRPDLTAERFVPDPLSEIPGARLYRTGDLARWRTDGTLDYLGRRDHQVKIRGVRVEPGEVEAVLEEHPDVRQAVVLAVPEPGSEALRLVAWYVGTPEPAELRGFLQDRLPAAIVPSLFVPLDAFPATPSGKVDRLALAHGHGLDGQTGPVPASATPRTPTEERLAGLWRDVLGVAQLGVEDNFFELGGHSLLATQLVSRIREAFRLEIPQRLLFEAPTLGGLAGRIDALSGFTRAMLPPITPAPRDAGPLPLSFSQERLWFLDELDPGTPTLNIPFSARLRQPLAEVPLARALDEVVRRHEALRTTFGSADGQPYQRVAPALHIPLPVADLRALAPAAREREALRLESEEVLLPFDLARGPLLRARLMRLDDADRLLLLTVHHIVSDGWSLGLLMRELRLLYGAFEEGLPSPLPELPVQYADYAAWQRRWLAGEALEAQIAGWRARLGDPAKPLPVLDLPIDRPRPAVQTYRGSSATHVIPPGLTERLGALARREGATLFMVLLAGFQALLARLSGQDDVVVGTPVAGRVRTETEPLIGCFLNNLALRTDLSGNPGFRELLGRARATALEAFENQDVPFERLLEELRVERDLSRTPLFQVFLNMLSFPTDEGGLGGTDEGMTAEVPSKFDLTIYAGETAEGLRLELVWNADLFDRERIAGLAAQLELLLARAAEDPETRIGEIPLLTPAAQAVLPDPAQPLPRRWLGSMAGRIAGHARRRPDAVAAVDRSGAWTYARFDAHAHRLASRLLAGGIEPGDVVAVFAHRGAGLAAALLGVWRSGAAFTILDPAYPPARLAAILDLARPRAFLRMEAAGTLPAEVEERLQGVPCLDLPEKEDDWEALGAADDLGIGNGPDDLAYLVFTSGSTGIPKAILGSHAPLSHFFDWHARTFELTEEDRFSVLSGLAHDPLLRDLFAPLWVGGTLCAPDPDTLGEPGRLAAWMARERVTVAHLTPAMGQLLAQGTQDELPALRRAFFAGDVLTGADLERLLELAPQVEMINFYGATETPQAMGWWAGEEGREGSVPLGRGIEGVQLLVLNPAGHLAGIGELGEIVIRTPYLAQGYLGDPAATAERFAPDSTGGRAYRTGDLGRYRSDGAVTFAGRVDAQIKIRGFRVELGDIEAALARHAAVREAAVVQGDSPDRPLLAFVVLDAASEVDLRGWLRGQLPAYMVPAAVVPLDRLPLTPNRKIDRRALAHLGTGALHRVAVANPRNPVEETLAVLWGDLLGLDPGRIGIHDAFFDLGGHSLLATRLLARLRDTFGVELPLFRLFETPTVAGLADAVADALRERSAEAAPALPPVTAVPRGAELPLSFGQERLWFLHRLEPDNPAYNLPHSLRLTGPLDAAALARAFREVTRRHEILRTRYVAVEGTPVQVVDSPGARLPLVDLSGLSLPRREAEAEQWIHRDAREPFDLAADHPLRVRLLRLGPEDHALSLTLHHIASDGWSNGLLVREVAELYRAFTAGRPAALPELPVQYADFAAWQRRAFASGALDPQRAWWRDRLADPPPPLDLPADRPRPAVPTSAGAWRDLTLPPDLAAAVDALGRRQGATLYMTLLAAFAAVLSRVSGQDDLAVGSPVAGRGRTELEGLLGFFVNTLVIRVDLAGDPSFAALLGRVRETALGAFVHQDVPFEKLVEELQPERDLSHPPLFQVLFVLQNAPAADLEVSGLSFQPVPADSGAATFDLTLSCAGDARGLGGLLQYRTDLFDAPTVDRLLGHFRNLLAAAAGHPERRLGDLPLLSLPERHQLVIEHNDTEVRRPDDLCLHELFERQVDRTPGAVALVVAATGEEITYGDLDARADLLAAWLRARGVGPEVSVGVALERSPELVVALLAVLKAGGAWVPLDPGYPPERLAFLIEDAAVSVLLDRESWPPQMGVGSPSPGGGWVEDGRGGQGVRMMPDHLAYRIYTSGSTGRPKAVLVPHRVIVHHMRWLQEAWPLAPSDVMLQTFSVSFDASFFDLWAPLLAGARLVLPSAGTARDAARTAEEIVRFGVTRYATVPPFMAELLDRPELSGNAALRQTFLGGQELPPGLARRILDRGWELVSFYGPSEATVTATAWRVEPGDRTVSIGRPIDNARIHLLGSAAEPLPLGVPGELCIGGAGVARGYAGRPDLTADRFRPDPFGGPGARLYRTGDRARRRPDGVLEFLGRVDRQVKLRGFRIEPGEVEAALAGHPAVRDAAVAARRSRGGEMRLIAYAVPREPVAVEELSAWLRERLPEPLIPAGWVLLDALPLTPNGKVDLAALPEPEAVRAAGERVPPRNDLERDLAAIWEELLDVHPVGVQDDFFALGGHSLLVLRLLARIEKRLGAKLPPSVLFAAPTIEKLAAVLQVGGAEAGPLVVLSPEGDRPPIVWVHAAAGTVTAYAEIARRLHDAAPDRPVWALQAPEVLPATLEDLAAGHVAALRIAQPEGPYRLAGWSFGGVIAFEMARQLRSSGAEVALLALVDSRAPGSVEIPEDLPSLLAAFAADQGLPPEVDALDIETLRPLFETFREHLGMLRSYRPEPYPGRIVLFRAEDRAVPAPDDLGWTRFADGGLEIRALSGDHAGAIRGVGAERLAEDLST